MFCIFFARISTNIRLVIGRIPDIQPGSDAEFVIRPDTDIIKGSNKTGTGMLPRLYFTITNKYQIYNQKKVCHYLVLMFKINHLNR